MILRARKPSTRWIAPAAAAGLVIASPAVLTSLASAEPTLPPRSAEELVSDVLSADPVAFTGEISQRTDLGLPDLSSVGGLDFSDPNSLLALASGSNTWRIWYDGGRAYRIAIIRDQTESDLISNGSVLWAWSSQSRTAVRTELDGATAADQTQLPAEAGSPQELARQVLSELEQYSTVQTDANLTVAGRAAYELVVKPEDESTRVKDVRIAVDAETQMPLRVLVHSTQVDEPVIDVAFTRLDYTAPSASTFEFTPPPGAEVIENTGSAEPLPSGTSAPVDQIPASDEEISSVESSGEGWSSVTVVPADASGAAAASGYLAGLLPAVSGEWGSGVVLDGTLVSLVITDDGRMAWGAVAPEALYEALAR
ncbi:sigma-E factor regulatory protein RseB domain-containing protein [Brooklawnia cerclae]|uniref:Outer membrane lipoprotein-sorting protein n=1 Tax=Brooklawnia cerclae TaxID=349934 RepID=A0ABX0SHJ3_9ACTN|nr:hypothetical protein [Brooklawnia cerclae]NIH56798.1 outer membrane lipoprotein-sorting protein [Brooklawnia cerclae]